MNENIWDNYANWSESAKHDDVRKLRRKITDIDMWNPNYVSPSLQFAFEALVALNRANHTEVTVLDFGCGLGRNAIMLRSFFPRVIALDLPEMIVRLKAEHMHYLPSLYHAVYDSLDELICAESVSVIYDSVVLQHIVSVPYVVELLNQFMRMSTLNAVVSLYNTVCIQTLANKLFIQDYGWKKVLSDRETETFGFPHELVVLRR